MMAAARDRARSIATDARNAVAMLLGALVNDENTASDLRSLASWCLTDDAAGPRERWGRALEKAAGEAAAPVWAVVEAASGRSPTTRRTGPDGLLWAVGEVLASPVFTDDLRDVIRADLTQKVAAIEAEDPDDLRKSFAVEWWWLGGEFSNVEPDDGSEPAAGFEVVARFAWPELDDKLPMRVIKRSEPPGYLRHFAWALWVGQWQEEANKAQSNAIYLRKRPPALTTAVYSPLMEAMGTKVRRSDIDSPQLPLIPLDASLALTLAAVQGLAGNALLRWVGITGHHAYLAGEEWTDFETDVRGRRGGVAGAELVIIRGGWSRLATLVGLSSRGETVADLREALRTLAGCSLRWRYAAREGGGSLLTWEGSLERGELKIGVSTPLLPYAGHRYWKKGDPSPRLVPLTRLPFMEGINPKARAAVARLDFLVWADLAERRVRPEGVEFDWPALAHQAGVTNYTLPQVLDLWSSPGEGQRWEVDGNLWRPFTGDLELATAWEFLLAGSANRTEAEERGRRGGRQPKPNRRR
jgi:hypothetical protein